ncbi:hypothetical protein SDC9_195931 [bioreactor metagenome]|uniref:Uncharacterized protein n=1 Tax=bioreactor metagenome TaxID=1076179 RepID=A0A645IJ41_9ZZZZ
MARHRALLQFRVSPVEVLAHAELQHRVAQKLQPLVVRLSLSVALDKRGMRQRRFQQGTVDKRIRKGFFQRFQRIDRLRHVAIPLCLYDVFDAA